MVPTKNVNLVGVANLEGKEEADGFDSLPSAVDVISKEEVVRFWRKPAILEQSEHIVVLSMDVSTNLERSIDLQEHGLFKEDGLHHSDQAQDIPLSQCH